MRTIMTKLTKAKPNRRGTRLDKPQRGLLRGVTERVVWHAVDDLKPFPGNPRRHPESQIVGLMKTSVRSGPIRSSSTKAQLFLQVTADSKRQSGLA